MLRKRVFIVAMLLLVAGGLLVVFTHQDPVDFNTQVKPIFNKKCISCHGGVKAKGGFSVLFREEALAPTESGKPAIIPGDPGGSEMIRRITHRDPEERMPYKHEPLSDDEIALLKRWVKEGAQWGDHWAYIAVKKPEVPEVQNNWVRNDIDRYILEKLEDLDLQPSAQADKATLLRRVSLDLTGLYPAESLAKRFLQSTDSNKAYATLVDSLLASPAFGERWASMWLDIARYADTKGYESDVARNIWHYRDWVIDAFNQDKPYNQFITEQIAGDMLPNPTDAHYVATAFHRNSMTNDEGGTSNEEFRVAAVLDRVNTTWEGLMGTTFSCVQCHSHPYDPFKHEEYYQFMAYFNNTRDEDVPPDYPLLRHFNDSLQQELDSLLVWTSRVSGTKDAAALKLMVKTGQPVIYSATAEAMTNSAIGNKNYALFLRNHAVARLKQVDLEGSDQLICRYNSGISGGIMQIRLDSANGPLLTTWKVEATSSYENIPVEYPKQIGRHDIYFIYDNPSLGSDKKDFVFYFDWLHFGRQFPGKGSAGYEEQKRRFYSLLTANAPTTPVLVENPAGMRRNTYVFDRGAWTSPGKPVKPGVPGTLAFAMPANAPENRLGLAMWLTDKRNPLVSRTIVNRIWEQLMGAGIAETLEDLGTQGLPPTHQALLDYLSYTFMHDDEWRMKSLMKRIVMSATYRQQSKLTEAMKVKDPFNRYFARGPRMRLSAEQLRDQHLCISGKLSPKMYGPGVMPWQPEGIWLSPYNGARWQNSTGEDLYRRAVYTYWKRTAPYPSMITFDGAPRVVCNARRIRTNTPLQALVTLNDSAYFDLARHFAYRMQKAEGNSPSQQIAHGYAMMLYRPIPPATAKAFGTLYNKALASFKKDQPAVEALIGEKNENTRPETAALVVVANAMMNMDEVIMKN